MEVLNRDLERLVYIDSKPFMFWTDPDNGIKNYI